MWEGFFAKTGKESHEGKRESQEYERKSQEKKRKPRIRHPSVICSDCDSRAFCDLCLGHPLQHLGFD